MTTRGIFLFGHILGFVLWFGIGFATAAIAVRARKGGNPSVVAFAYRSTHALLRGPGLFGAFLAIFCGFALTGIAGYGFFEPFPNHWMFQMQLLGVVAFVALIALQLPTAARLATAAERVELEGSDEAFEPLRKRHAMLSSVTGLMVLVAMLMGALRPF